MKYMGSKARFASQIAAVMPPPVKTYIEPFAGGMNMMSAMSAPIRIANDVNHYLIAMFSALLSGWTPPSFVSRQEYNDVRLSPHAFPDHLVGYIGFNCSYKGKFFGGYAGITQTKQGVRDYQAEALRNLAKQLPLLANVTFTSMSYDQLHIPPSSLVYCDPPYKDTTSYTLPFDHDAFYDWVRDISKHSSVYVSEYQCPPDFTCVWSASASSSLSANGVSGGNRASVEKLFTLRP